MSKQKNGLLGMLLGLFSAKAGADDLKADLRKQIAEAEKKGLGLEYDIKTKEAVREETIRKGTEAARRSRSIEKQKCAMRLQILNAQLSEMLQNHAMLARMQSVAELALGRLEMAAPGGITELVKRIQHGLRDPRFENLIGDTQLELEAFRREAGKILYEYTGSLEGGEVQDKAITTPYDDLFDRLAKQEDEGKEEEARETLNQMTKLPSEHSTEDQLMDMDL